MAIRPWRESDADALVRALNDARVLDDLRDGLPSPYTRSDALDFITAILTSGEASYGFAIADGGECAGAITVTRGANIHRCTGELGYYVLPERWGRGLATDAVREICRYTFEHTDIIRIYAEPFSDNTASCRVLEKAGFTFEGTLRANAVKHGSVRDMRMYALIRPESR